MKLLANTVLFYRDNPVNYEILLIKDTLVFKPFFYHIDSSFSCIFLSRLSTGWQLQETVDSHIKKQIQEDLLSLQLNQHYKE